MSEHPVFDMGDPHTPTRRPRRLRLLLGLLPVAGVLVLLATNAASSASTADWQGSFNASYQSASPGDTIVVPAGTYSNQVVNRRDSLRGGTCSTTDLSRCITFVMGGPVQINGNLELHGAGIRVDGGGKLRVSGYTDTEADTVSTSPDHVVFENMQTGNIGVYSSTDVTFRNVDVGPSTVGAGCNRNENKIAFGSGIEVVPRNVLFDTIKIHNQNVNAAGRASDCHYGGLFIVNVDGLVIRNSTFERNVVYNVQIQNFAGPAPRNMLFQNNSFGCPVEWLDEQGENTCDGQPSIQLNTSSSGVTANITGNVTANGTGGTAQRSGTFGCQTPCSQAGITQSNNTNLAASPNAPPLTPNPPPPPPPPPPPTCPGENGGLTLTKLSQTNNTVTFGWQPVANAIGYRFTSSATPGEYSHTWDGQRSSVKFAKNSTCYFVGALMAGPTGGATG